MILEGSKIKTKKLAQTLFRIIERHFLGWSAGCCFFEGAGSGGVVILSFLIIIGFILATGISVAAVIRNAGRLGLAVFMYVKNFFGLLRKK